MLQLNIDQSATTTIRHPSHDHRTSQTITLQHLGSDEHTNGK
jgi:hypothetical protein